MEPCELCGGTETHADGCPNGEHTPSMGQPDLTPAPERKPRGPDKKPRKRRRARSPLAATDGVPHKGLVDAAAAAAEGDADAPAGGPAPTPAKRPGGGHVTKAQLAEHNARLEREVASLKAKLAPAAAEMDEAHVAAALTGTFATLFGKILPTVLGVPGCAITDDEAATLGAAWAPVAAPLMAEHGDKAPWVLAVVTTAGIGYRPVMAYLEAKRAASPALPGNVPALSH